MVALVTVEQVSAALKLEPDEVGSSGADIDQKIAQSQAAVIRHLKAQADDSWTSETAPYEVSAAIILGVKSLLDEGGADMLGALATGVPGPNNPIGSLLHALRDPALA